MNLLKKELIKNGYIKFNNLIETSLLNHLNILCTELVIKQSNKDKKKQASTGSMINIEIDEIFLNLITHEKITETFKSIGYETPKWSSGYIIGKPPDSPPLYWHSDWWAWNDPISYKSDPTMVFVMFYLTETTRANGCLRVIPGSHLKYNNVHNTIKKHHSYYRLYKNPNDPVFDVVDDEIEITSSVGDVILGDSRLLHAANANKSNEMRVVITLWYYPNFDHLHDHIKASSEHKWPENWSKKSKEKLQSYFPSYTDNTKKIKWNRIRSK